MELAYWIMIAAALAFSIAYVLSVCFLDSLGELFIPIVYLSGCVFACAATVFVVMFGLDALGFTVQHA